MNSSWIVLFATIGLSIGTYAAIAPTLQNAQSGTAEAHSMSPMEVETTRRVREDITNDRTLSVRAHNVKIITENGRVILKGPVANKEEHAKISKIALAAAKGLNVVNQTYVEQ